MKILLKFKTNIYLEIDICHQKSAMKTFYSILPQFQNIESALESLVQTQLPLTGRRHRLRRQTTCGAIRKVNLPATHPSAIWFVLLLDVCFLEDVHVCNEFLFDSVAWQRI